MVELNGEVLTRLMVGAHYTCFADYSREIIISTSNNSPYETEMQASSKSQEYKDIKLKFIHSTKFLIFCSNSPVDGEVLTRLMAAILRKMMKLYEGPGSIVDPYKYIYVWLCPTQCP